MYLIRFWTEFCYENNNKKKNNVGNYCSRPRLFMHTFDVSGTEKKITKTLKTLVNGDRYYSGKTVKYYKM